jgi:hypothetical protein
MKILDTADVRIVRVGDNPGITMPPEYEGLEGFTARLEAAVEDS